MPKLNIKANRYVVRVLAVAVVAQAACFLAGWPLAGLVIFAAYVGFAVGHGTGFHHGLAQGYANFLALELKKLDEIEAAVTAEFAPDSAERKMFAESKAYLTRELKRVA